VSAGLTLGWRAATMPAIGCPDPGEKTSQPWARRKEDAGQQTGECLDPGLDVVLPDGGDQIETGRKTGDADVVGGAGLEFPAVGVMLETL